MAKILVTDPGEGTRVPFLRGILTRSLQDAGLAFERAYDIASTIRTELGEGPGETREISTAELRRLVLRRLQRLASPEQTRAYQASGRGVEAIQVRTAAGNVSPFSRAELRRCLESCGLTSEESADITRKVHVELLRENATHTSSHHLRRLTYRRLKEDLGPGSARRYLVWMEFLHSGRPLLLLIGGVPGSGKSTIANDIAHRLDSARTQSTDMLREVMRMLVPKQLMPVLHASSFTAWRALPGSRMGREPGANAVLDGYHAQAELVSVAVQAAIQRALTERVSLVIEGVHLHPAVLQRVPHDTDAIVVPILLAVLKPEQLRARIRGRGRKVPDRRTERYLDHFDDIWRLQSDLLSQAEQDPSNSINIIVNDNKEKAIRQVMSTIIDALAHAFSRDSEARTGND